MVQFLLMRNYLFIFLTCSIFTACIGESGTAKGAKEYLLSVTIEPQRYFLEQLVGPEYTVNTLVPRGVSPETFEPSPLMMIELGKSNLYFRVGDLGFEKAWSARLERNNPEVKIVDCSEGIELMKEEEHLHAAADGQGHAHPALDPHVWSSPRTMRVFVRNMLDALLENDPDREEFYRGNYNRLVQHIDSVDRVVCGLLEKAPTRSFIIYHPALGYFARDYGLKQYSIEFEGKAPSPGQLKKLVDLARKEQINTLFVQKGFDLKNGEVIAREIGTELFEIDPLAYEWADEIIGIATILSRKNDEEIGGRE